MLHDCTHYEGVTPFLADGQTLLYMATVWGIGEIPVLVVIRHPEYVDTQMR